MAQCSRCKEELPLLSKICPVCGYVAEGDETAISPEECIDNLERILYDLKAIPQPTLLKGMGQMTVLIYPVLAVFMLAMALISEGMFFWILCALFGVLSLASVLRKIAGRLGNDRSNEQFRALKNNYEYSERLARRNFGKSREVSTLLGDISAQIADMESSRKQASRRNMLIWLVIVAAIAILAGGGVFSASKVVKSNDPNTTTERVNGATENWQQKIEAFKNSSDNHEHGDNAARLEVLTSVLSQNQPTAAEEFFSECCQGNVGDYECAQLIVRYYLENNNRDAASSFVGNVTPRYGSDKDKLQKMIH